MVGPAANAEPVPSPRTSDFELASDDTRLSDPPDSVDDHEHETRFFDDGHKIQTPHAFAVEELDLEVEAPKPSPKASPLARARRAHFSKYVKGAMVAATAILALAGIRAVMGHADRDPRSFASAQNLAAPGIVEVRRGAEVAAAAAATVGTTGANVAHSPEPSREIPPPPEPAATAKPEEKPAEPAKVEAKAEPAAPAAEAVKPAEAAKPAEPAKVEAKAEPAKPAEPTKAAEPAAAAKPATTPGTLTAAQEKVESRKALERGKAGLAIEAGERSVALDPADGEAWLILGAAYQEKGNVKDARRAFQSCTKEGKRGPISECRAMLQ